MTTLVFKKNKVLAEDVTVEAKPGETILEAAAENGIPVGSNCGGVCGCSTCHVYVSKGFDSLEEMEEAEEDRLDRAFDVKLNSRLGCQAEIGETKLVIDIADESLKAYFDENPDIRKHFEATGEFKFVPHHHH